MSSGANSEPFLYLLEESAVFRAAKSCGLGVAPLTHGASCVPGLALPA